MQLRSDHCLTDLEINKLHAIANLMTKFEKFSTMLGGDKYVTMSYLKVMLIKIREHIQETTSDIQIIKDMKKTMRDNLLRYTTEDQKNMLDITIVKNTLSQTMYGVDDVRSLVTYGSKINCI